MNPPPIGSFIALVLITATAYMTYRLTGFGNVVISMPLMLIFLHMHIASPVAMLLDLCVGSTVGVDKHRHE